MAEMMRRGMGGMGKMGSEMPGKGEMKKPASMATTDPMMDKGNTGEMKTHMITEHPDGHFESQMHGGEMMEHPDHMHMMAHMGHHLTGGDAHKVVHHDGMEMHSHMMGEDGMHKDMEGDHPMESMMGGGGMDEEKPMEGGMQGHEMYGGV